MSEIRFCVRCGKILEEEYLFCPYCGSEQNATDLLEDILEEPFEKMERIVQKNAIERLQFIEEQLKTLEIELNGFLLTTRRAC
jgi:anaerobic ribonucleoside-triphosphate reductase